MQGEIPIMASSMALKRLSGKVAIVTASTAGIGYEIAKRFAENGAKVMVSSRNDDNVKEAVRKLRSKQLDVSGVVCHFGEEDHRTHLIQTTLDTYGRLDTVVLNAAVNPSAGPFFNTSESEWDKILDLNLKCGFLFAKEVFPHLQATKGSMLFVSSMVALHPSHVVGAYSVAKAAMLALVKVLTLECGEHNVRVNAIAPGIIDTEFASFWTRKHSKVGKGILKLTALKRYGEPVECAGSAVFLCSDDASYITGETIPITGGFTAGAVGNLLTEKQKSSTE